MSANKRFMRSRKERMIGGVCGGIAEYFDLDPTLIRLVFVLLVLVGAGSPILFYLILWVIMPPDKGERFDENGENELLAEAGEADRERSGAEMELPVADSDVEQL